MRLHLQRTSADAARLKRVHAQIRACARCVAGGYRRPSPPEIALCAPWLEAEIALVRPEVVLLVGTLALDRLWGKSALSEAVGRSKRRPDLGGALLIPLPHPSGASRWLNDPANR